MICSQEWPVNAISWDDKVMFNGYERWKPDVERCTRSLPILHLAWQSPGVVIFSDNPYPADHIWG